MSLRSGAEPSPEHMDQDKTPVEMILDTCGYSDIDTAMDDLLAYHLNKADDIEWALWRYRRARNDGDPEWIADAEDDLWFAFNDPLE